MEELGQFRREGLGKKSNRRLSLIFLLAVSVMMFVFSLYGAQASVFEKARETLLDIVEPVLSVFNRPLRFVDNRIGNITDYFNYLEQNERLREENAELRTWMNEAITLRRQVTYYQELLDVQFDEAAEAIDTRVVGETGGPYQRSLIINAGRSQGIETGDAVIDTEGLIGHVVTTGNSASRVLMLTDFSSRVPVFIEDAGIEAIVAGKYLDAPELMFLETRDIETLQPGMRIVTSGAGGNLPRGIPVGSVDSIDERTIKVRLFSKYNDTDFVRVLDYDFIEISVDEDIGADTAIIAAESEVGSSDPEN